MNEQTTTRMRQMKFFGMLRAFQTSLESGKFNDLTADEMVSHLIMEEWDDRYNRKIARGMKNARFRYSASMEQVQYDASRTIDRNLVNRLSDCTFIEKKENVLITGSAGIGKSYLASALGQQACTMGYRVIYASTNKLFTKLKMAKADGSYVSEISKLERQQLLILDDFGLQPLDAQNRSALMEIIEDRHGKASTIITSQLPVSKWYEIIGEQTIADAILDRIIHDAHRLNLEGESLRKRKGRTDNDTNEAD